VNNQHRKPKGNKITEKNDKTQPYVNNVTEPDMAIPDIMIYIAPISRIESEALASLGGEHD